MQIRQEPSILYQYFWTTGQV